MVIISSSLLIVQSQNSLRIRIIISSKFINCTIPKFFENQNYYFIQVY